MRRRKGHFGNLRGGKKWPCGANKEPLFGASNLANLINCVYLFVFVNSGLSEPRTLNLWFTIHTGVVHVDVLKECLVFVTEHY